MDANIIETCEFCNETISLDSEHICESNLNTEINRPYNTLTSVDEIETFIEAVAQRKHLWDSSLPYAYRNAANVKNTWTELDVIFNVAPGTSQTKWRNLRDTYVRKLSEQTKYIKSGSSTVEKPHKETWPFFEIMEFLRPADFSNIKARSTSKVPHTDTLKYNLAQNQCVSQEILSFQQPTAKNNIDELSVDTNIYEDSQQLQRSSTPLSKITYPLTPSPTRSISSSTASSDVPQNYTAKRIRMSKKQQGHTDQQVNKMSQMETNLLDQLKATDAAINSLSTQDVLDPVISFTNYLGSRIKQLPKEKFEMLQRKILMELFNIEDF